jgi:hypothetical protein
LSEGQSVAEFAKVWGEKLKDAAVVGKTEDEPGSGTGAGGKGETGAVKVEETVGR